MTKISKAKDEKLIEALAQGESIAKAAEFANVSRQTIYNRLHDLAFVAAVRTRRREILDQALGRLSRAAVSAAETLNGLLEIPKGDNPPPAPERRVQLSAARAILELGPRLQAVVEFEERIERLEKQVELRMLQRTKR